MRIFRRTLPSVLAALISSAATLLGQTDEPAPARALSFSPKNGLPPVHVAFVWKDSTLQGLEVRAKAGGSILQRIKIGESETIATDLDQEDLPPKWIGTLDYNGDGWKDIYLQVAQGAEPTHAILIYEPKTKRFTATMALAAIRGLDLSLNGGAAGAAARKIESSFAVVTKDPMKPVKLSISGPPLKKGDEVTVLRFGEEQIVLSAQVAERIEASEDESGATYTLVCVPEPTENDAMVGIGVINAIHGITADAAHLASTRVAAGPAGNRLYFRSCFSGEGMHLTVWSGKPLTGTRVWHRYHSLGYDVEPSCTPKDYRE